MKLRNQQLRDRIAAEYVLGTLSGLARRRFQQMLRYDKWLRRTVADWEARLLPLAEAAPEVEPPAHLWHAIRKRISGRRAPEPAAPRVGFWRMLALGTSALAAVLLLYLGIAPRPEAPISAVALL